MSWLTLAKWGISAAAVYFGGKACNIWGKNEPQAQQPTQGGQQAYPPQYQQYPPQYPPQGYYPQTMPPDFSSSLFGMKYQNDIFAAPMFAQMMGGGGYAQPQYQYPPQIQ